MTDEQQTTELDLEKQFMFYLVKVNLDPSGMPRQQIVELRRAFYAGWAQFIRIILQGFANKPDEWAENALTIIEAQVALFWQQENEKVQSRKN